MDQIQTTSIINVLNEINENLDRIATSLEAKDDIERLQGINESLRQRVETYQGALDSLGITPQYPYYPLCCDA